MNNTIILLERARRELIKAWNWYEEKQKGLGDRFELKASERIEQIHQHPELYPIKHLQFHETKVKDFPYFIIYSYIKTERTIVIVSIFHSSRNPQLKYMK